MSDQLPQPVDVFRAVEIYLKHAYFDAAAPATIKARIEQLRAAQDLYSSSALERDSNDNPTRYSLRLGNKNYPHMKLTIDRRPDGAGFLFRADTHDRHICPRPDSKEYVMFREMMDQNQKMAQEIEQAWAKAGIPTF